jgi:putative 4-mercaptohistidine N1-methyltranferase
MSAIYESPRLLAEYLLFHYGSPDEILPPETPWPAGMRDALDFPVRTARGFPPGEVARGLDLGCAVGRSTFEMARDCREVTGIDFSSSFIAAAEALREGAVLPYERLEEAVTTTRLEARAPADVDPLRIRFATGDAMDLPASLGTFDRVHAANLLCRLPEPRRLLERLPALVRPGGHLLLATPCTWLEEFTPPAHWPTGSTFDWLLATLGPHFELVERRDEPFLIRETARKFQWTRSLVTLWTRRGDLIGEMNQGPTT